MRETEITLCAIPYIVQEHEGLWVFSERSGFYGVNSRIEFERKNTGHWYLRIVCNLPSGNVMFNHVQKAHQWLIDNAGRGEGEK